LDLDLYSGLIGAVIGGVLSIIGGFAATLFNLFSQKKTILNQQLDKAKKSAEVMYADIFGIIKVMLTFSKEQQSSKFVHLAFATDYTNYIANLQGKISGDEIYLINQLYGYLISYQRITLFPTLNSTEKYLYLNEDFESFCKSVYESKEEFVKHTGFLNSGLTESNYEKLFKGMTEKYIKLLENLKAIKSEHS